MYPDYSNLYEEARFTPLKADLSAILRNLTSNWGTFTIGESTAGF